jgi:hypothetical protein
VTRKICGGKRVEIAGKWRKLHNEQFHDLYFYHTSLELQIKKSETGGACSRHGEKINN